MNRNIPNQKLNAESGFSLLEIMVAVAILSISFLALLNFEGQSLVLTGRSEKLTLATFLGQEKMAEVILEFESDVASGAFPDEKSDSGRFDEPYEDISWSWQIRRVEIPVPEETGGDPMGIMFKAVAEEIAKAVREVRLTITWEELGKEQSFDVVTHFTKL